MVNKLVGGIWGLKPIISKTFKTELNVLLRSETRPCFTLKQKPASKGRLFSLEKNSKISAEDEYLVHMALAHLILINRIRG